MRVHVERDWERMRFLVYVTRPAGDASERLVLVGEDGFGQTWRWVSMDLGVRAEPSLELPEEVLPAIVAAASDHLPPSAATDRHLDDATAVRDRLLALVEHSVRGAS